MESFLGKVSALRVKNMYFYTLTKIYRGKCSFALKLKHPLVLKAVGKGILFFFLLGSLWSCSRKKNTFLNRNWHAVTAEYNTLFNGNNALELGKEELALHYQDDYWQILPVERMQIREAILAPGDSKNPNFKIAEEKAVKAIQRHSMLLEGREQNPQIDEAYLLLGKAHYFDQRFVPAVEAFNYILHKYPLSNSINQARIWRAKTNLRMEFNEVAIKNLKEILKQKALKNQDRADASAILGQAYINLNELDSAVVPLKSAAELTQGNDEKGRYLYIVGQLYDALGKLDSANLAFDEVIDLNRKTSRVYRINALISKITNAQDPDKKAEILELLTQLEENRENRLFLDKIYFQLAEFYKDMDSTAPAVAYYNKSLREPSENSYLQSLNYQTLGNINFDASQYKDAGAYYDSTLMRLQGKTREFRLIKKKRDNLEDVIFYENVTQTNDSVLHLVNLSQPEQLEYFTRYTETLKITAKSLAENPKAGEIPVSQDFFESSGKGIPGVPNPSNAFYFYNPTTVAYGKEEFFRIWGDIELQDNWRSKKNKIARGTEAEDSLVQEMVFENNPIYDPETYIKQIPTNPETVDSLQAERNFAYYQLGLIYKEKFGEDALAAEKLENLLESGPEERLILPASYNLYKIYLDQGALAKAGAMKNHIIFQYPESRYAQILQNPEEFQENENNPENIYAQVYKQYSNKEFETVISRSEELVKKFTGDAIVPKFELLKAMAIGRLKGLEAYKEAINYVALNYPQSIAGRKAQEIYDNQLPELEKEHFEKKESNSYLLVVPFKDSEEDSAAEYSKKLRKLVEGLNFSGYKISVDVYNSKERFVVVHRFKNLISAKNFAELLQKDENTDLNRDHFSISSSNYRILQIHKNLVEYQNFLQHKKKETTP